MFRVNMYRCIQTVLIAELLQCKEALDIFHLRSQRNVGAVAFRQAQTEHVGESGYHFTDLVFVICDCHPIDRILCIIEEMRIDLTLQQSQFRIFFFQIFNKIVPDQGVHTFNHLLIGLIDTGDFFRQTFKIFFRWKDCLPIFISVRIHDFRQSDDRAG